MDRERSGGSWCSKCDKCITLPRKRKNFCPPWFTLCDECGVDVLEVTFCPSEDSITTHFKVKYKDINKLIELLILQDRKINGSSSHY